MKQKRILSILLTACMILSMIPTKVLAAENQSPFVDVKTTDWFYNAVQYVYEEGMMSGTGSGRFSPNMTTSRGMIVTILYRLEGTPTVSRATFTDVGTDMYYSDAVAWASSNKIVSGYGNGKFGPNDLITREQLATILYRYAQYKEYDTSSVGSVFSFVDGSSVSNYAIAAMNWAVGAGLLSGTGDNVLYPAGNATRAQVATILMRFYEEENPSEVDIQLLHPYSEGIAWIEYTDEENSYWVMVDKKGNAIARFPKSEFKWVSSFQDGYATVRVDIIDGIGANHYCTIDTDGKVVRKYGSSGYDFSTDDKGEVYLLNTAGYTVGAKDLSNFDDIGYKCTIYDRDGSVLEEFDYDEDSLDSLQITYCGQGVFQFDNIGYYFAKSKTWDENLGDITPDFRNSDIAVIDTTYSDEDDVRKGGIWLMTSDGETYKYISESLSDWTVTPSTVNENVCVVYDMRSDSLVSVNISEKMSYKLDERYSEKMQGASPRIYKYSDGRIVVNLLGADKDFYVAVFDAHMNLVFGPIKGEANTSYSDSRLVLDNGVVYDTDGNIVFSLSDKGYEMWSNQYSDGVLIVTDKANREYKYLDTEGKLLFDKINFENVITYRSFDCY